MNGTLAMHLSPRCTATSKRTRLRCQAAAVTGWTVCRFHGARGGGPKGSATAPTGTGSTRLRRWRSGGPWVNYCEGAEDR